MIKRTIKKILRIILALLSCMVLFVVPVSASDDLSFTNDDYIFNTPILTLDDYSSSDMLESGSAYDNGNKVWNWYDFNSTITLYSGYYMFLTQSRLKVDVQSGTYDITVKIKFSTGTGFSQGSGFFSAWTSDEEKIVNGHVASKCTYKDGYAYYTFKDVNLSKDVNLIRVEFDMFMNNTTELTTNPVLWTFDKQDTTEGLLSGIIEFIKGIYNGIIDLPNKIADSISGFFTWIVNAIDTMKNFLGGLLQSIIDGLIALGNFILDGLKSLFIPSDGFFTSLFNDLYDFFDEKLGVLFLPFELLGMVLEQFLAITEGSGIFTIPDVHVMDYKIISSTTFDLKGAFTRILGDYYPIYYAFVDVGFILIFINSVKDKFDQITTGGKQ